MNYGILLTIEVMEGVSIGTLSTALASVGQATVLSKTTARCATTYRVAIIPKEDSGR
jgi:hypothetical protein